MNEELPLRGPDLPDPVSWWPPAPGWWILALLVVVLLVFLWFYSKKGFNPKRSLQLLAQKELTRIEREHADDPMQQIQALSVLLRRVAVSHFGRQQCAGVTGDRWLKLLDSAWDKQGFSEGIGRIILDHPYKLMVRVEELQQDATQLRELVQSWLKVLAK